MTKKGRRRLRWTIKDRSGSTVGKVTIRSIDVAEEKSATKIEIVVAIEWDTIVETLADRFCDLAKGVLETLRQKQNDGSPRDDSAETGKKRCPVCGCGHVFQGTGWGGIDAHWKAHHEDIMPYKDAWPQIKQGKTFCDANSCDGETDCCRTC